MVLNPASLKIRIEDKNLRSPLRVTNAEHLQFFSRSTLNILSASFLAWKASLEKYIKPEFTALRFEENICTFVHYVPCLYIYIFLYAISFGYTAYICYPF